MTQSSKTTAVKGHITERIKEALALADDLDVNKLNIKPIIAYNITNSSILLPSAFTSEVYYIIFWTIAQVVLFRICII